MILYVAIDNRCARPLVSDNNNNKNNNEDILILLSRIMQSVSSSNPSSFIPKFFLILAFYVRPSDFWSLFKVRLVMGALIVTLIKHKEKMFQTPAGIKPGTFLSWAVCLNRLTKALPNLILLIPKESESENNFH